MDDGGWMKEDGGGWETDRRRCRFNGRVPGFAGVLGNRGNGETMKRGDEETGKRRRWETDGRRCRYNGRMPGATDDAAESMKRGIEETGKRRRWETDGRQCRFNGGRRVLP
jgi:hypothetical protein